MTRRTIMIIVIVVFALAGLLGWWLWPSAESVWQPATESYAPERCSKGECDPVLEIPFAADQSVTLTYDPRIDDAVAQWADCLEAVVGCIEKAKGAPAAYPVCVAQSSCPVSCRKAFAKRASGAGRKEEMIAAMEAVFLAPDALCNPARRKAGRDADGGR